MREDEDIPALGTVCISLYQCTPSTSSGSYSSCGTAGDYRGDVLVPFYKGGVTYRELAGGVEYRLNKYFVIHPSKAPESAKSPTQKPLMHGVNSCKCSSNAGGGSSSSSNGCCFNGSYLCSRCTGCDDSTRMASMQKSDGVYEEFPKIVVRNFTRARSSVHGNESMIYDVVDDKVEVTENKLCCFFYYVKVKCTNDVFSVVLKNGAVKRALIGKDHIREYASRGAASDRGGVRQHIELKVGERLLRIGTSAEQRFEDIFERLRKRNLQVRRLFDGVTGASILPCELVRHLSWKVTALCADVVVPLSGRGVVGAKRERLSEGGDDEEEKNADDITLGIMKKEESAEEVGTWISLSEVSAGAYIDGTLHLTQGSLGSSDNTIVKENEGLSSWNYEQLLQKTTFGFDEDDDTVPLPTIFSRSHSQTSRGASTEEVNGNTPFRSLYVEDDSFASPTPAGGRHNGVDGSNITFVTPVRVENDISLLDSGADRGVQQHMSQTVLGDYSPIMVTQQSLPDFVIDNSDDDDDEEEEEEDDVPGSDVSN